MAKSLNIATPFLVRNGRNFNGYDNVHDVALLQRGTNQIIGTTVDNYRQKIVLKQDASSGYSRKSYEWAKAQKPFICTVRRDLVAGKPTTYCEWWIHNMQQTDLIASETPSGYWVTATDDLALKRHKQKVSSGYNEFKALVPLGEYKETLGLMRTTADIAKDMLHFLVDLRHAKLRDAARIASEAWLQFSFAIAPTISDIQQLADTIVQTLTESGQTMNVKAGAAYQWSDSKVLGNSVSVPGGIWRAGPIERNHSYFVTYSGGYNFKIRSANNYGLASNFGLSFGEIIPAAWELLMFSWLADYFSTMGDWLQDTFTAPSGTGYYLTKSTYYEVKVRQAYELVMTSGYSSPENHRIQTNEYIFRNYIRSALSGLPTRSLRVKSVEEISSNALNKLANLASILGSKPSLRPAKQAKTSRNTVYLDFSKVTFL